MLTKQTVLIVAAVGIALLILGILLAGSTHSAIAGIIFWVGLVVSFVGWILGIVKTAMIQSWGWLVVCIIFGALGALIYGIFGPEGSTTARPFGTA